MMKKLTEHTLVPIGFAISIIGGSVAWLTTMHVQQQAMASNLATKDAILDKVNTDIQTMKLDLAEIKVLLKKR